jgi:hypothetical protein
VVFTILPFCPSVLYAQAIAKESSWRYNGILVGLWNFIGLLLCIFAYKDPSRLTEEYTARHVLRQVDYIGGFLSTAGVTCFMMGLQWGASQVSSCYERRVDTHLQFKVPMGKRSQPRAVDPRHRAHYHVLRLGALRAISDGSESVVQ